MTEYMIVHGVVIEVLEKQVAKYMAEGWKPTGGVAVIQEGEKRRRWFQAMVR